MFGLLSGGGSAEEGTNSWWSGCDGSQRYSPVSKQTTQMVDALSMRFKENTQALKYDYELQSSTENKVNHCSISLILVLFSIQSLPTRKARQQLVPSYRYKANTKACADLPLSTRSLSGWLLFYSQWGVQRIPHTRQGFVPTASTEHMYTTKTSQANACYSYL